GLERAVAQRLFAGKIPVVLQTRQYQYEGEVRQRGALSALGMLEQSALPAEVEEAVRTHLTTADQLERLRRTLETCVNFLAVFSNGGARAVVDPDMLLSRFATEMASVGEDHRLEALCPAAAKQVRLRHLKAFFLCVEAGTTGGILGRVLHRYRDPLGTAEEQALHASCRDMRLETLVTALRDLLTGPLSDPETTFPAEESLKNFLVYVDMDLADSRWYQDGFPETLQLRHALEAFRAITGVFTASASRK
ncbi:hypothetical protein CYMTET_26655, partial [Cymbomonas tetramitiformis]